MKYVVNKADILKEKQRIIDFWNENNKNELDEKFSWFYESNPDGIADTWLLTKETSSEIVGMATLFPRFFNNQGKTYRAGIQGDFFISKKHRSFGPALTLIRSISESFKDLNYDFIYGFPNRAAEPILRRAGFKRLGCLEKHVRLFDIERLLNEKFHAHNTIISATAKLGNVFLSLLYPDTWNFNFKRHRVKASLSIQNNVKDLTDSYSRSCFSTQKSFEYLRWKYEQDPDDKNFFFTVLDLDDTIIGCIVYRFDNNTIEIREIIYRNNQLEFMDLLSRFFRYAKSKNVEYAYFVSYENSCVLSRIADLQLSRANQGRSIYFLTNKMADSDGEITRLITESKLNLHNTDEDT